MNTTKEKLIEQLEKMPELINEKSEDIYNKRQTYEEMLYVLKQTERTTTFQVTDELDENGKAKFSNAQKREAEAERRLSENKDYQQKKTDAENLKVLIDNLSMQLEFVRNKFSSARAIARLLSSED